MLGGGGGEYTINQQGQTEHQIIYRKSTTPPITRILFKILK